MFGINTAVTNAYIMHKEFCRIAEAKRQAVLDTIRGKERKKAWVKKHPKIKPMKHKKFIEALAKDLATQSPSTESRKRAAGMCTATDEPQVVAEARNPKTRKKGHSYAKYRMPPRGQKLPDERLKCPGLPVTKSETEPLDWLGRCQYCRWNIGERPRAELHCSECYIQCCTEECLHKFHNKK